jgi:hypothetical protein
MPRGAVVVAIAIASETPKTCRESDGYYWCCRIFPLSTFVGEFQSGISREYYFEFSEHWKVWGFAVVSIPRKKLRFFRQVLFGSFLHCHRSVADVGLPGGVREWRWRPSTAWRR